MSSENNIPKMFTDEAIKNELADLDESIKMKYIEINIRDEDIHANIEQLKLEKEYKRESIYWITSTPSYQAGLRSAETDDAFKKIETKHSGSINRLEDSISNDKRYCSKLYSEIRKLEKRKNDLKLLQDRSEEKRAEDHYSKLIEIKKSSDKIIEKLSVEHRYTNLYHNRAKIVSTEEQFRYLYKEFIAMDGYKDTAELALECDKKYNALKEAREVGEKQEKERMRQEEMRKKQEEERKQQEELRQRQEQYEMLVQKMRMASTEEEYKYLDRKFRGLGDYKNAIELANKCETEYVRLSDMRTASHNKQIKDKKIKKFLFIVVLGGIIGGLVFRLLNNAVSVAVSNSEAGPPVLILAMVVGVLLGIYMLKAGGCWYGFGGFFIGTVIVVISAGLCAESVTTAVVSGVVIGGLVGAVIGGAKEFG